MKRDWGLVGKVRDKNKRPVWRGPIPDRYYYLVRNKQISSSAHVVLLSDDPEYGPIIKQIATCKDGDISLIESLRPLPVGTEGVLKRHEIVEKVKEKLNKSHDRRAWYIVGSDQRPEHIPGEPVLEDELWQL